MGRQIIIIFFVLSVLFWAPVAQAFPIIEKTTSSGVPPLSAFGSEPDFIFVPTAGDFKDKYLFYPDSTSLGVFDLETWDTYHVSIDSFSDAVVSVALLNNGTSLIIGLANGNLARIELDDEDSYINTYEDSSTTEEEETTEEETSESLSLRFQTTEDDTTTDEETEETTEEDTTGVTDTREIESSADMTSAGLDKVVADPDNENFVYMINYAEGLIFIFNLGSNTLTEANLTDSTATATETDTDGDGIADTSTTANHVATDMVFVSSDGGNQILVTTDSGKLLVVDPSSLDFTEITLSSSSSDITETEPSLSGIALTPDQNHAYMLDTTNDVVWAYSTVSDDFLDQQSSGSGLDPVVVDSDDNATFTGLGFFEDPDGEVVGYLAGASGLTLLDGNDPGSSSDKVLDADESSGTATDPVSLSGTPGQVTSTSNTAGSGYVFAANGDASLSILTENPWINITSISSESLTADTSTFTITFNSDTAGTYTIYANSNPSKTSGTELISAVSIAADASTDITTDTIDINSFERSTFIEGTNKIFVFVDDGAGNLGHTAKLVTVDRPPEAIEIEGVNFGNKRAVINFHTSTDEDIDYYTLYAEAANSQSNPLCPGSLTFTSADSNTVSASDCGDGICENSVSGLTNGTVYCVAVTVTDLGGQTSPLATFATPVVPEQTVGPAGFLGETGCSLHAKSRTTTLSIFIYILILLILPCVRFLKTPRHIRNLSVIFVGALIFGLLQSSAALGQERSPQNWTLEVRGTVWFPSDSGFKSFTGGCCHFAGEVEFGLLLKNRYNFTVTAGGGYESGNAVGVASGAPSSDKFSLMLIPMRLDFIYRFDFKPDQFVLPYVRAGFDSVFFRESAGGESIMNVKFGVHGGAGLGFLLDKMEQMGPELEDDAGVNDVYLIVEARYALINSFKSTGLDLSGFYPYIGVLFEF